MNDAGLAFHFDPVALARGNTAGAGRPVTDSDYQAPTPDDTP